MLDSKSTRYIERLVDALLDEQRRLQGRLERIGSILEHLQDVRELMKDSPQEVIALLEGAIADDDDAPKGTHYERIVAFLRGQRGSPTIGEIEQGTGIPRASISAVLYRTHAEDFVPVERDGRAKGWRLRASAPPPSADEDIPF